MGNGSLATEYDGSPGTRAERTTELAGNADGEVGIFSTWFRIDGGNNTQRVIFQGGPVTGPHLIDLRPLPLIGSGDRIQIQLNKVSPVTFAVLGRSTQTFTSGPTWRHLLISWDTGLTSGTPRLTMHIDDVLEPLSPFLVSPGVIDYTRGNYSIGGRSATPQLTFPGCFSEYYFNSVATLDMSVVANRRKFIDASGLPVELGSNGQLPTGIVPIMYFPDGDATTNAGSGGTFVNFGGIGPCTTVPGRRTPRQTIEEVCDELQACIDANPGDTPLADKLQDAKDKLIVALEELDKVPPDVQAALGNVEGSVGDIQAAVDDGLITAAKGNLLMDDLAEAAMVLADDAIDDAIARDGDEFVIDDAQALRNEGNGLRASGQFKDAVAKYKDAVAKAESA